MFPELRLGRGKTDIPFMPECSPLILTTMASHEPLQLLYPLQKEASLLKLVASLVPGHTIVI